MSLAELFYAKNSAKQSRPVRRVCHRWHSVLPRRRPVLFEPLELRLLLSVTPTILPNLDPDPPVPLVASLEETGLAPPSPATLADLDLLAERTKEWPGNLRELSRTLTRLFHSDTAGPIIAMARQHAPGLRGANGHTGHPGSFRSGTDARALASVYAAFGPAPTNDIGETLQVDGNLAPVALPNVYLSREDTPLTVTAAQGVLANDGIPIATRWPPGSSVPPPMAR